MWIVQPELRAEYKKAMVRNSAPTKSETKAKNISGNDRRSQEKLARREASAPEPSDPLATNKRVTNIEFLQASEGVRAEKRRATLAARVLH